MFKTGYERIFFVLFCVFVVVYLFFVHVRGFTSHDEGWVINSAKRVLDGELPYKDFQFLYTPGTIFVTSLFLLIFGESILSERIAALLISFCCSILVYKVTKSVSKNTLFSSASVLCFVLFGSTIVNFVWPIMPSLLLGLLNTYLLLKLSTEKHERLAFFVGITAALVFFFKQNFALAIVIYNVFCFITLSNLRSKAYLFKYLKGYLAGCILILMYFVLTQSLFVFISETYYLLFQKIFLDGMLSSRFIAPDVWYKQVIKGLFYLLPLIISLYSVFVCYKRRSNFIILPIFTSFYYLLSIRPTTDYIHLAPLLSLSGLSLAPLFTFKQTKKLAAFSLFFLILIGIYSFFKQGYYKWEAPILSQNIYMSLPRTKIFVDSKNDYQIKQLQKVFENSHSSYVFIHHFAPMYYFIFDKKNPTYYDCFQIPLMTKKAQEDVIDDINKKSVKLILTDTNLIGDSTIFANYVKASFNQKYKTQDYYIWERKSLTDK